MAVVVQHGGGAVLTACVGFDGASLTGEQVMNAAGIQYAYVDYGGSLGKAVCQVDHEPATYPPSCFAAGTPYWGMFVSRQGGAWATSNRGISSQSFADGDALGWHYVPSSGGPPPPSPAGVCAAALAPPPPAPAPAPPAGGSGQAGPGTPTEAPVAAATPTPEPAPSPPASPTAVPPAPAGTPSPASSAGRAGSTGRGGGGGGIDPGLAGAVALGGGLAGLVLLRLAVPRLRS